MFKTCCFVLVWLRLFFRFYGVFKHFFHLRLFVGKACIDVFGKRLFPLGGEVEYDGYHHTYAPADRPRPPNSVSAECLAEKKRKHYTEYQISERRYHKLDHLSATAQYAVAHDFDRYDKVERGYDTQELHAYVKRARR